MMAVSRRSFLTIAAVGAALGTLAGPAIAATSSRKGVSVNNLDGATANLSDVGASWFYTWASDTQGIDIPTGVEFVPMIWGADAVNPTQLGQAESLGSTLLGFNEPDMPGQANMSVAQALSLWPQLQATGPRLGAPAVAYGGDTAGGWLDQFISGARTQNYRVDFIPLHWYGGDFSAAASGELRSYLAAVHNRYGLPVWLTEYALIDFSGSAPVYPSQDQQVAFIDESTAMLDGLPYLERYAWFSLSTTTSPTGLYTGTTPNAGGVAYRSAS